MKHDGLYTLTDVRNELKKAGLPSSRPTLIHYEKQGILLEPSTKVGKWRFYTAERVREIVQNVILHQAQYEK